MILVIFVHVANVYCSNYNGISKLSYLGGITFNVLSRISVPIFFMISGALLLHKPFDKKKYFSRLIKFLAIIIVWDAVYLVWEYFYLGKVRTDLTPLLVEPYRKHLWFLYTIIVIYALQPILGKIMDILSKKQKLFCAITLFMICNICMIYPRIAPKFTLLCYIGYFIVGDYLYKISKDGQFKQHNKLLLSTFLICIVLDIIFSYYISLKHNTFINIYFSYRESFIIIASFCFFILTMNNYKNEDNKLVKKLSEYSFGIYLIHGIFLDIVKTNISIFMVNSFIGIPVFSLIILAMSIGGVAILKKIPIVNKYLV